MKLLWLSHLVPYPPKGGVLQRTYNMIKEIGKYHEVTLVAFNQEKLLSVSLPDQSDPLGYAKKQLLEHVTSISVFPIAEYQMPAGRYLMALKATFSAQAYNMVWLKSSYARKELVKLVSREKFDAVHIDTVSLCVYADLFKGIPVILNHHNFESEMLKARSKKESNLLKALFYRYEAARLLKSETEFCRQSLLNITCSDEDAKTMESSISGARFTSVPNGVDVSYFYPNPSVKIVKNSILLVGGLSWYPNREAVEYFMRDIWPAIKKRVPGISAHIVGKAPTNEMLALAQSDKQFFVHGFVDDVRDYLWSAQFYLCPIRSGGGTKLKILDALASGCCIIADPFACKGIKVQNETEVIYAKTPHEYADAIVDLLNKPVTTEHLRKAGPELIRREYSYSSIGKRYSETLKELVIEFQSETRSN